MSVLLVLLSVAVPSATAADRIAIPACTGGGPCVVVQAIGADGGVQQSTQVDAATIIGPDADVQDASYPVEGGTAVSVKPGSSIGRLLTLLQQRDSSFDPSAVTYAEVVWDDAYQRHLLTGAEIRQGDLRPAFYTTDPGPAIDYLSYVRPQRGAGDDNGAPGPDQGVHLSDRRGAILVRVHTAGSVLRPQVTATATDAGNRTYALSTDQSGPATTYDWVLPDGSRSSEARPTFTFATGSLAGTYPVSVGVGTSDGSFGWGSTDLRAGAPPAQAPTAGPSGPGGTGTASKGPRKNPSATRSADPNPAPTGSTGTPQASPTATATGSSGPVSPDAPGTLAPRPSATATASATPTEVPPTAGDQVSGILLAGATVVDPATGEAADGAVADPPPPSPSARALGSAPLRVATAVWVGGGVLLLLLLGAVSESGRLPVRRLRWRRMTP